jgi:hypothetical protein
LSSSLSFRNPAPSRQRRIHPRTASQLPSRLADFANNFTNAAVAFEEQAHPTVFTDFEAFDARDNLAGILLTSAPLSGEAAAKFSLLLI